MKIIKRLLILLLLISCDKLGIGNSNPTIEIEILDGHQGNYHKIISCEKSRDIDGTIEEYEYMITEGGSGNKYHIITKKTKIDYSFPAEGNYIIYCKIKDNEGGESKKTINYNITVNK